jgi:hypothetical protein
MAMNIDKLSEATILLKKIWVVFLIGLYSASFLNEYHFPGVREKPLDGEKVLWQIQQVIFFGLMFLGLLVDLVEMRIDRKRAFRFMVISLLMGGLSTWVGAFHFKLFSYIVSPSSPGVTM